MNVDYLTIPDGYKTIIKKFLIEKNKNEKNNTITSY